MSTPRPFAGLGFALGSVRGVRTFRYVNRTEEWSDIGPAGSLVGLYYPQVWGDGPNRAECRKSDRAFNYFGNEAYRLYEDGRVDREVLEPQRFDPVPKDGEHLPACHCGFYAYFDGSNDYYDPDKYGPDLIAGVIEGWGEVLVGARGFRCTDARIVALNITSKHPAFELIRARYPDVTVFDSFDRMVHVYPEDDGGIREEYRIAREEAEAAKRARQQIARLEDDGGPVI